MTDHGAKLLEAQEATYGYPGREAFLQPVKLAVRAGERWGVIGPNGAGKSTLLRLLAGLVPPKSGRILLDGRDLATTGLRRRAQRMAFLPQHVPVDLATGARDVVLLGRYPHRGLGLFEDSGDAGAVDAAMAATETSGFADRPLRSLSGGEAQRVHLAAALAQEPAVLLLDEPTVSLDLFHQLRVFELLVRNAQSRGTGIVVVTHDVNLAARHCTHVLLMHDGRVAAIGSPDEVVQPGVLEPVYGVRLAAAGDGARRWVYPISCENGSARSRP